MAMRHKKTTRSRPAWGKIVAGLLATAALAAAWRYTPLSEFLTPQHIAGWARAARGTAWMPVAIVLVYTPASIVMFPRPLLTLFAVVAFGPWLGFAYSMSGIMLSALTLYLGGRSLPQERVKRIAGDGFDQLTARTRKHGLLAVFALRMTPITPFPVDGLVCGAARIRLFDYLAGTFLGIVPGVLATTVFGHQISRALEDFSRINYWILGGVVVFFVATTYWFGKWLSSKQN